MTLRDLLNVASKGLGHNTKMPFYLFNLLAIHRATV